MLAYTSEMRGFLVRFSAGAWRPWLARSAGDGASFSGSTCTICSQHCSIARISEDFPVPRCLLANRVLYPQGSTSWLTPAAGDQNLETADGLARLREGPPVGDRKDRHDEFLLAMVRIMAGSIVGVLVIVYAG